ncbi:hypothetical protein H8D36_04095 [archaeon]|nr:hypothetical protein [archaeon]MBL7056879.1 hypothetical protein [Candidatus Woesearchaeota archaeon]
MKKNSLIIISLLLISIFLISACSPNNSKYFDNEGNGEFSDTKISAYKSRYCGCCVGYVAELEKYSFDIETIEMEDLTSIKNQHNIPQSLQSCHTSVVGEYFIEGHVPIEAVRKLLEEKPDIDGIGLAGMPSGTPGMPGAKREAWHIYALKDGIQSEFMTI